MYIYNLSNKPNDLNKHIDFDHMVYVRLFEGCNLNCEHCFIPPNPKKIDPFDFQDDKFTNSLLNNSNIQLGDTLYIQWHGGEPTIFGSKYLDESISNLISDKRFTYKHGIQTNLINFAEDPEGWSAVYKKHFNSSIGVSWDPDIRHLKTNNSPEITNQQYEEIFWNNVNLAQSKEIELYFVITATKLFFTRYKDPFLFFDFMVEKGVKSINLERVTNTGLARGIWDKIGLSNLEYSNYMSKFFKSYILFKESNPDVELNISPFDGLLNSVIKLNISQTNSNYEKNGYGCWSGKCDTKFHTIDANGYKHGCTALTSEQDNNNRLLTNSLKDKKIIWIGSAQKSQKESIIEERNSRKNSCLSCDYNSICSSGCLSVEKWDFSNECSGGSVLFRTIDNLVKKELSL